MHWGAFLVAGGVGLTVLGMTGVVGAGPVLIMGALIAMVYFAVAASLHIGKLAACLAIIRGEELAQLGVTEFQKIPKEYLGSEFLPRK